MKMMKPTTTALRAAGALTLALALAACSALPERPEHPKTWDLGAPPALQGAAAQGAALSLSAIRATPALEGNALHYRLLYDTEGDLQPRPYAHSRWASPVPQMLAQRLQQVLAASRPVLEGGSGRLAPLDLRLTLDEFAQHFANESESSSVIQMRATLFGGQPRRLLAQRSFAATRTAPSPDAAGGVHALREATNDIAAQLDAWLRQYDGVTAEQVKK